MQVDSKCAVQCLHEGCYVYLVTSTVSTVSSIICTSTVSTVSKISSMGMRSVVRRGDGKALESWAQVAAETRARMLLDPRLKQGHTQI